MNPFKLIAILGLAASAIGPILAFFGAIGVPANKIVMLVGMVMWFVGATPWLGSRALRPADTEVEI